MQLLLAAQLSCELHDASCCLCVRLNGKEEPMNSRRRGIETWQRKLPLHAVRRVGLRSEIKQESSCFGCKEHGSPLQPKSTGLLKRVLF
jgi:hypothetical protein